MKNLRLGSSWAAVFVVWLAWCGSLAAEPAYNADPDPSRPTLHVQPPALTPVEPGKVPPLTPRAVNGITFIDVMVASGLDYGGSDYGNEPAITANPVDPSRIVLTSFSGSNWGAGGNSSIFYSSNGGASWVYSLSVPPPPGTTSTYYCPCDQTLDWGRDGRLHATFLYFYSNGTAGVYSAQTTSPTVAASWVYPQSAGVAKTTSLPTIFFPDQPWLWTGPTPGDVTATGVAVGYDNFELGYTTVEPRAATSPGLDPDDFTRDAATSTDGQIYNDGMNAGNRIAVGPDGKIFNVFQRLDAVLGSGVKQLTYLVTVSTDGGQTFSVANSDHSSGAKIVASNVYSFQGNGSKVGGVNALLGGVDAITVDPNTGTAWIVYGARTTTVANDQLFLVPVTYSNGDLIVGTARAVTLTSSSASLPGVAVLPNGEVGVLYLAYISPNFAWRLVQTIDGGATISKSTTITSFTSPFASNPTQSNQRIFGDYVQLRAVGCTFYGTFAARGSGANSVTSIDPYFMTATPATACSLPTLTQLTPSVTCVGGPDLPLGLTGTGFNNGAVGRFGGALRNTAYGSPTSATMTVNAADLVTPGTVAIDLLGAVPAGGLSGSLPLAIEAPAASPGSTLAAGHDATSVNLSWAVSGGATHYNVLRCGSNAGPCTPAPIATPTVNTYDDPVYADGNSYWYLVQSANSCPGTN